VQVPSFDMQHHPHRDQFHHTKCYKQIQKDNATLCLDGKVASNFIFLFFGGEGVWLSEVFITTIYNQKMGKFLLNWLIASIQYL